MGTNGQSRLSTASQLRTMSGIDATILGMIVCYPNINCSQLKNLVSKVEDPKAKAIAQAIWASKAELKKQPKEVREAVRVLKSWVSYF